MATKIWAPRIEDGDVKFLSKEAAWKVDDARNVGIWFFGALFSGAFLMWSAPVHELGHVIAAYLVGGTGTITGWSKSMVEPATPFVTVVGYPFEATFILLLGRMAYRRSMLGPLVFCIVSAVIVYFEAFGSLDFQILRKDGAAGLIGIYALYVPAVATLLFATASKKR